MKAIYYIVLVAAISMFVTSCGNQYEKTISDYILQQNADADMEVQVKDIKELRKVTVGDSVTYINQTSELSLRHQVEATEEQISKYQEQIVGEKNGNASKIIVEAYTKEIVKLKLAGDSLKAIKPTPTTLYNDRKTDEILAVIVEANFTIKDIKMGNSTSRISHFVLSPDGKICYESITNPEKDAIKF